MSVEFHPLSGAFGVRLDGIDLRDDQPIEVRQAVRAAWLDQSLILVRGQHLDVEQHKRFVEWFGPISTAGYAASSDNAEKYISNTRADGVAREGSLLKHQDFCFYDTLLPGLSLYAEEVPASGGETIFASTSVAYQRLPAALKQRIGALEARHVYDYGNDRGTQRFRIAAAPKAPTATHPVVLPHPATHRPLLFVNELMTDSIVGLADRERRFVARAVVISRRSGGALRTPLAGRRSHRVGQLGAATRTSRLCPRRAPVTSPVPDRRVKRVGQTQLDVLIRDSRASIRSNSGATRLAVRSAAGVLHRVSCMATNWCCIAEVAPTQLVERRVVIFAPPLVGGDRDRRLARPRTRPR